MAETLIDPNNIRLRVTDGEFVARQSSLGQIDICGLRFKFDRQTPPGTYHTGSARAVGTAYHKALETFYSEHQANMTPTTVGVITEACLESGAASYRAEVARGGKQFHLGYGDSHEENQMRVRSMLIKYFDRGHYLRRADWTVLGTEVTFWDECSGQKLRGTIDLLVQSTITGAYKIVDHKTAGRAWPKGKEDPRKNVQAPFYFRYFVPAWCESVGVEVDYADWSWQYDVMNYAGRFDRRDGTPTPWHLKLIQKKLEIAQKMIAADTFMPNPSSFLCSSKWCDHWYGTCPWGAAAS